MKIAQVVLRHPLDVVQALAPLHDMQPQWLLVFGSGAWLHGLEPVLAERFP